MKDVNNEREGEEEEAREALTEASGKILLYNQETAMWSKTPPPSPPKKVPSSYEMKHDRASSPTM